MKIPVEFRSVCELCNEYSELSPPVPDTFLSHLPPHQQSKVLLKPSKNIKNHIRVLLLRTYKSTSTTSATTSSTTTTIILYSYTTSSTSNLFLLIVSGQSYD